MIHNLFLQDFQSHEKTNLELGQYTVLVGPSSSGKSAVVRALKMLSLGGSLAKYVRAGSSEAKIAVRMDDSLVARSGSSYLVSFSDRTEESLSFSKCGLEVPQQVREQLGLSDINFSDQHSMPLLLSSSPSAVATELSDLTGTLKLQESVKVAEGSIRDIKSKIKESEQSVEQLKAKIESMKYVPDRLKELEKAKQLVSEARTLQASASNIKSVCALVRTEAGNLADTPRIRPPVRSELSVGVLGLARLVEVVCASLCAEEGARSAQEAVTEAAAKVEECKRQQAVVVEEGEICETCPLLS